MRVDPAAFRLVLFHQGHMNEGSSSDFKRELTCYHCTKGHGRLEHFKASKAGLGNDSRAEFQAEDGFCCVTLKEDNEKRKDGGNK